MANTISTANRPASVPNDFLDKLGKMRRAERELTIALPLVIKAAKSQELKALLRIHLTQTAGHIQLLDEVAKHLDHELPNKSCRPMTKLIAKAVTVIGKRIVSSDQDQALIRVGREIEQFEMHSYRELCATAEKEGLTHEVALLTSILSQEEMANELLAGLGAGKGSLKELFENVSLKRAGAGRAAA